MSVRSRLKSTIIALAGRARQSIRVDQLLSMESAVPLYRAGATTWRCNRCGDLVWMVDEEVGCSCESGDGPIPLEPKDPMSRTDASQHRFMELEEMCAGQLVMIEQMGLTTLAARHLVNVISLQSQDGAVFRLSNPDDAKSAQILMHAIMALQSQLEGTDVPELCMRGKKN